jgi:hypothetical protein
MIVPWLAPAERLLAPYLAPRVSPTGPPDGFGALARRGPYERLLLSEWLLWQELPDEFLRRAASAEHLFQAVVRKQPAGRGQWVALFDVGPGQIGAPRLAQIALLAVFSRRAAVAGATFAWGALQHPDQGLLTSLGLAELRRFLSWRTDSPPDDEQWRAWCAVILGGRTDPETSVWTVGAPARPRSARAFHVEIREPEAPLETALTLRVTGVGGVSPPVSLPLPPAQLQVAVLRDEREASRSAPGALPLLDARAVAFAPVGGRLFVRPNERTVQAWSIPPRPVDTPPSCRVHVLSSRETFLAAGWQKRRFVVVAVAGTDIIVHGIYRGRKAPAVRFPNAAGTMLGTEQLLAVACIEPKLGGLLIADGQRTVLRLDLATGQATRLFPRVLAAIESERRFVTLRETDRGLALVADAGDGQERRGNLPAAWGGSIFASAAPSAGDLAVFAYRGGPFMWRLVSAQGPIVELHPSTSAEVLGVSWLRGQPALLLCEADRRTLSLVGRQHAQVVHVAAAPILFATPNPQGYDVAVVTEAAVSVVDREGHTLVQLPRARPGAAP